MSHNVTGPREWWESFAVALPPDCSHIQRNEMKKSFIAGMFATLETLKQVGDELSEDAGVVFLDSYHQTLIAMASEAIAESKELIN